MANLKKGFKLKTGIKIKKAQIKALKQPLEKRRMEAEKVNRTRMT